MNVCPVPAIPMRYVTTLLVALHVPVTLDIREMEYLVVSFSIAICIYSIVDPHAFHLSPPQPALMVKFV